MYCLAWDFVSIYSFFSYRVTENESINKMSLHNLATVFGPTLLRPSEKDSKISNSSQPISMNDSWSLEVMAQVKPVSGYWLERYLDYLVWVWSPCSVSVGASPSLLPSAGEHSNTWQQTPKPSLLHWSITWTSYSVRKCSVQRQTVSCLMGRMLLSGHGWFTLRMLDLATRWNR